MIGIILRIYSGKKKKRLKSLYYVSFILPEIGEGSADEIHAKSCITKDNYQEKTLFWFGKTLLLVINFLRMDCL